MKSTKSRTPQKQGSPRKASREAGPASGCQCVTLNPEVTQAMPNMGAENPGKWFIQVLPNSLLNDCVLTESQALKTWFKIVVVNSGRLRQENGRLESGLGVSKDKTWDQGVYLSMKALGSSCTREQKKERKEQDLVLWPFREA